MTTDPDEWIDEQLLIGDSSRSHWTQRSLNGLNQTACIKAIPDTGQVLVRVPMEGFRYLTTWCEEQGITRFTLMRTALLDYLTRHPDFPTERVASLDVKRNR